MAERRKLRPIPTEENERKMSTKSKKTNEKSAKKDGKKEARKLKIVSAKDARKHRNAAKNAAKKAKEAAQNAAKKAKAAADNEARKAKAAAKKEAFKAKGVAKKEALKVKKEAIRAKQEHKANARTARKAQAKAARAGKKERVIHTRVSQNLERELRESAADLGVSVSNLVRNVLLNTFGLVEGLVVDGARVAHSARGETAPQPPVVQKPVTEDAGSVLGWQAILLNMNALCAQCNAILPKGGEAFVGVLQGTGTKPIRCATCVKAG